MGSTFDAWQLAGGFTMQSPRNLGAVGGNDQAVQLARWANTLPFLDLSNNPLPAQQSVTANGVFGDILDFKATVRPQRLGQLIVAFVQVRASRAVGTAQCQLQVTVQVGSAAAVLQPGMFFLSATLDSKLHMVPYVASSTRPHTFQVQGANAGGATTWLIRSPESSITILTI